MVMRKSKPSLNTTARLWISHLFIYYFILVFLSSLFSARKFFSVESLKMLLSSPLLGLIGYLDHFPCFFVFPIILMLFLYYRIFKKEVFNSYKYSLLISYSILYIYLFNINGLKSDFYDIDFYVFIIPSLILSITVNWLLFGKNEKK
ncbi:hypothetical protein HNQ02_002859 [Flavobacterium sp. 7E]|nr:hypothetical protein [Flavobacterium sp. 7E]